MSPDSIHQWPPGNRYVAAEAYQRKVMGSVVSYGNIVQLLHVKSGKMLTVRPNQRAEIEKVHINTMYHDRVTSGRVDLLNHNLDQHSVACSDV